MVRTYCKKAEYLFYLKYAKDSLAERYEKVKTSIFNELDNITQSSSMVENKYLTKINHTKIV